MKDDAPLAFVVEHHDKPEIEIQVNFGVFAGRAATAAEIDDLARWLLDVVADVTIISEERHEFDRTVEVSLHLVRIELARAPGDRFARRELAERLRERAEHWARACIADRHYL
ncbi:MAG: hypothetical protein JO017_08920 [Actinobacteria bacterium]|nr:hypothetical protein [Actinomycetota bacterium]